MYIVVYDVLFGREVSLLRGDAEKYLERRKDALEAALAKLLVKNKVKTVDQLVSLFQPLEIDRLCCVRVNTLKLDVDTALLELGKDFKVQKDALVHDLLVLPPRSDLHNHLLVMNGSIFMQGKASPMVAAALDPRPGSGVLDACSAPGTKTVQLAALMKGKGRVIACELNKERIKRLEETITLSGATNIEVLLGDFLNLDTTDPSFAKVSAILLDPSCSGSGTAAFQKKALAHALSCMFTLPRRLRKGHFFHRDALSSNT